ncbi:hypothetical protein UA08_04901 [Talaromyces atroroseus]|uniref:Carboxylic ester hydrolase n=1 Tax=Talaromyces atroroseus TaxID=1441469 RepID=A0A225AX10_TALAT|nr:hypothetical protein UA08_04901 [Talaromyces atroroseus]OKL60159.1 hypothetical protein UA08_04901 [Talaromyces atroroseus]
MVSSSSSSSIARPTVHLAQGTVVGTVQNEFSKAPVQSFRGIPYALPPTGDRRFRRPVKVPADPSRIIDASKYGAVAPGKVFVASGPKLEISEDCLTVNVFRQVPREDDGLLPVLVYIHGGAFNRGSASMHNTASMVAWSDSPFIGVSFNYRLGSLGFLPSKLSAKEGILNLGLHDQVLLFEWVQENIQAFGGDKDNITLAGLSAGAHSVGHHMMRYSQSNPGPFQRVIIESGSPTSRAVRRYDAEIHEQQFQDFLEQVKCANDIPEDEIFPFLRSLPLETITQAQNAVFDKYNPSLRWAFQPVIDGELIPRAPMDSWRMNDYYKVPILTGFTENEGSLYVNKQMETGDEFTNFFRTLLPQLSDDDIQMIEKLYPDPHSSADQTYKLHAGMTGVGRQYRRIEAAYGQYAYSAPARQTAHMASTRQIAPVYLYHWAAKSSVIGGATHGDNMRYETLNEEIINRSASQRDLAGTFHAYVTSFICHKGDPNATAGEWQSRPKWLAYKQDEPKTMIFGKDNNELIGGDVGITAELSDDPWAREECIFWRDRAALTQQ